MPMPRPAMTEDQLAELAMEFTRRVRSGADPDDTGAWLLSETTEADRWALHFVQAAVGRTSEDEFRRVTAFARVKQPEFVDDIAVERACHGERLALNRLELAAAVKRLTKRGLSVAATARLLRISERRVVRMTRSEAEWAREVA